MLADTRLVWATWSPAEVPVLQDNGPVSHRLSLHIQLQPVSHFLLVLPQQPKVCLRLLIANVNSITLHVSVLPC